MVMLEQLLNTGNCICSLSNAASTVAKRVLTSLGYYAIYFLM